MFGGDGIQYGHRMIGRVRDDRFLFEHTEPGSASKPRLDRALPYQAAVPSLVIVPEPSDEADWINARSRGGRDGNAAEEGNLATLVPNRPHSEGPWTDAKKLPKRLGFGSGGASGSTHPRFAPRGRDLGHRLDRTFRRWIEPYRDVIGHGAYCGHVYRIITYAMNFLSVGEDAHSLVETAFIYHDIGLRIVTELARLHPSAAPALDCNEKYCSDLNPGACAMRSTGIIRSPPIPAWRRRS